MSNPNIEGIIGLENKVNLTPEEHSKIIKPLLEEGNYSGALRFLESWKENYLGTL